MKCQREVLLLYGEQLQLLSQVSAVLGTVFHLLLEFSCRMEEVDDSLGPVLFMALNVQKKVESHFVAVVSSCAHFE